MARKKEEVEKIAKNTHLCPGDTFNGGFMHVVHMFYVSIQKHLEQTLTKEGKISFSQFLVLIGFYCEEQSTLTQAKLAEYLMLTEATVSRHIGILVTKKLLHKEKDSTNKKIYNLTLTEEGKKTVERSKKLIHEELDTIFKHISEKDKSSIIKNFSQTLAILHKKK